MLKSYRIAGLTTLGVLLTAVTLALSQPSPPLRISASPASGGLLLEWATPGEALQYVVQYRNDLTDAIWLTPRTSQPWPREETSFLAQPPPGTAQRFYRVRAVETAMRGALLESVDRMTVKRSELAVLFSLANLPIKPDYDVQIVRLVYETIDPRGNRTWASGALALPLAALGPIPLASYQHGTLTRKQDAPSMAELDGELFIGVAFATTGYAVALPDYLGLGESPGLHPYHHATSQATAGVDMLRAVRAYGAAGGVPLGDELFLFGYSQGGHATMALHRELQEYHAEELPVTASAPMAGAYDLSGVTADYFLSDDPMPNPYYLAYLIAAYQDVYRFAPTFADLLREPYDRLLPPMFDGLTGSGTINAILPTSPVEILKPEILAALRSDPNHPLRVALRDNDLYRWIPRGPVRLFHCEGDRDVLFANSQAALAAFQATGAGQVELVDPNPSGDHGSCVLPALMEVKGWFDSLRR